MLTAFGLGFGIGFERGIRGSSAGDRTFGLIAAGAAALTAAVGDHSPQAIAGVVSGVGFIGAGVVLHGGAGMVRGITTAASVFATACVGIVAGAGHLGLALLTAGLMVVTLELPFVPVLRLLDTRRYQHDARSDDDPPMGMDDPAP